MVELNINAEDIETVAVAIEVYKRQRLDDALRYNREGIPELSDSAWRDAARLDVYWHELTALLPKNER